MSIELELIPELPQVIPVEVAQFIKGDKGADGDVTPELEALAQETQQASEQAVAAAGTAITASDAAQLSAGVFATTADGIAATLNGHYFSVPSPENSEYLILYQNVSASAVEKKRYPSAQAVSALNEYINSILRHDDVEELLISATDINGARSWIEAEAKKGGPSLWALTHLKRTMGVSLLDDVVGYLAAFADSTGKLTDLCIRDTDGQVPDFVMQRWANRLTAMGIGGDAAPKTAYNNISEMRKTRMRFGQLASGDAAIQLHFGFNGDSYTDGQGYYLRELCKRLAKDYGFAGPGYMGFTTGGALADSNFLFNTTNPLYFGGSWTISPLGTASPNNRTITAGAAGDYVSIQAVDAPNISTVLTSARLIYLGSGADPVVRYRWNDGDAWNNITLTGSGARAIDLVVLPAGINWKFRLEVVSGLPTLFGLFGKNSANGVICSKMAASGSATADWYKPNDSAWMTQQKAVIGLIPAVDCYMVMLGGNDQGFGVTPATYLANMQGIIGYLREINVSADICITIRQDTSRVSTYPMSAYADVVRSWAWPLRIPCSDMQFAFGTNPVEYASDGALPLIGADKTHPIPETGGRLITEFFFRLLRAAQ